MKKQRGEAVIALMAIMALTSLVPSIVAATADYTRAHCNFGYLHNSVSGAQIIGPNGGGIPCTVVSAEEAAK